MIGNTSKLMIKNKKILRKFDSNNLPITNKVERMKKMKQRMIAIVAAALLVVSFMSVAAAFTPNVTVKGCKVVPASLNCKQLGVNLFNNNEGFASGVNGTLEFTKVKRDGDDYIVFFERTWNITDAWSNRDYKHVRKVRITDTGKSLRIGAEVEL